MEPLRVLVVDDEAPVRELFCDLLRREKLEVSSCVSGEEALEVITRQEFELVLLDIKLSGISGFEVLVRLKAIKPALVIVIITGFGYDEHLIAQSEEYGADGYIGKNTPIPEIIEQIRALARSLKRH